MQNEYIAFNSDIIRTAGTTPLAFPYSKEDCYIAPNDFIVEDTFNASIKKLYDNMVYMENMSKLYDIPPTQYIGLFGTL